MEPFTFVVVGAVVLFVLVGVGSVLAGGSMYDKIGEGGLSAGPTTPPMPGSPQDRAEQELEIRQMLRARNERRVRSGEAPLDVDAELARLIGAEQNAGGQGKHDPVLVEEVRQLVVARNERLMRRGEAPLDVDAEVRRTLAELDPDNS